jgi:hypothetical protein
MIVWRMRTACWIPKATDTPIISNTYCFSTAAMAARTCLLFVTCKLPVLFPVSKVSSFLTTKAIPTSSYCRRLERLDLASTWQFVFISWSLINYMANKTYNVPWKMYSCTVLIQFRTVLFIFSVSAAQHGLWPPLTRFRDHTQRHATGGRTPMDEWSARRRDLYLTTHDTHNKHSCPRQDSNSGSK